MTKKLRMYSSWSRTRSLRRPKTSMSFPPHAELPPTMSHVTGNANRKSVLRKPYYLQKSLGAQKKPFSGGTQAACHAASISPIAEATFRCQKGGHVRRPNGALLSVPCAKGLEERCAFLPQQGHILSGNRPDQGVVDSGIRVRQLVAEVDDPACVGDIDEIRPLIRLHRGAASCARWTGRCTGSSQPRP